jgi:hypothetical protein
MNALRKLQNIFYSPFFFFFQFFYGTDKMGVIIFLQHLSQIRFIKRVMLYLMVDTHFVTQ